MNLVIIFFSEYSDRTESMGAGASKDGEEIEVDERYVSQSQSGSASGPTSPRPRSERKSVGQARKASRMSMSRNSGKQSIKMLLQYLYNTPHNNTPRYNTNLDLTLSCCGFQFL